MRSVILTHAPAPHPPSQLSGVETIGADLGGTKMLIGVVDEEADVRHRRKEVSFDLTTEQLLDTLERELNEAREACPDVAAAGLGIPCTIDAERGVAITAVNLPIVDLPIRDLIEERVGMPVFIDNDANTAALAEHRFGAARGADNVVMLTIGTGIGGGLILGGEVYRGSSGAAAELGHTVVEIDGPPCQGSCPNHGCIEAVASGTALAREAHDAAERTPASALGRALARGERITGEFATRAALDGDETAREVLALLGRRLGTAFSSFANTFDPDVIVVGGGVAAAGDLLLEPAREELRARALPPMNRTPVALAELGSDAGMIGAATFAICQLATGDVPAPARGGN
jgi:glucokinase